jgi:pyridoxal phosphate enzyme (YggS family)
MSLPERFEKIKAEIASALQVACRTDSVTLIAVSKVQPVEAILELYKLGQRDFGENYVQELVEKAEYCHAFGIKDIRWHFIGHLQRNKVKQLVPFVSSIQSVDSLRLAEEISKRCKEQRETALPIFLSVNIDDEDSKSGLAAADTASTCKKVSSLEGLELQGLMCIPSPGSSKDAFARLGALELKCRPYTHGKLSMGMSDDFSAAIAEGATHIRVGTSLFKR